MNGLKCNIIYMGYFEVGEVINIVLSYGYFEGIICIYDIEDLVIVKY